MFGCPSILRGYARLSMRYRRTKILMTRHCHQLGSDRACRAFSSWLHRMLTPPAESKKASRAMKLLRRVRSERILARQMKAMAMARSRARSKKYAVCLSPTLGSEWLYQASCLGPDIITSAMRSTLLVRCEANKHRSRHPLLPYPHL